MAFRANAVALAALMFPAGVSAQEAPKSILPPGFEQAPQERRAPVQLPPPAVDQAAASVPGQPGAELPPSDAPPVPGTGPLPTGVPPAAPVPPAPAEQLAPLPSSPPQAIERIGLLGPEQGGYGDALWQGSDGRFLTALANRVDRPLASRWMQILLQRALLTKAQAPAGVNPADWLAARARALTRMGSATDAHRLTAAAPLDRYTADLYLVAGEAAIAAGDPLAMCPLVTTARSLTDNNAWVMADAWCSSIAGDDETPQQIFDNLRRTDALNPSDIGLAERIAGAAGEGRRSANPTWEEVKGLTPWRLGLASVGGIPVPDGLFAEATPVQAALAFRLPGLGIARRAGAAPLAVATGAAGSAEANRLFAAQFANLSPGDAAESAAGRLRALWTAADLEDRIEAMRDLLGRARDNSATRYGWRAIMAPALSRLSPQPGLFDAAPDIVAALAAAGMADAALRWRPAADAEGEAGARTWAVLAPLGLGGDRFDEWAKLVTPHRAALLAAGMAGLGREIGDAPKPVTNAWTGALDRAVAARRPGEVMLVAAAGLRLGWANVPPDYLRRIAAALVAVGRGAEARLIVAEAATRG